jgi:hypothetical protein
MDKPVAVNDEFVSLVLAAKEDAAFRQRLLNILRISEPERRLLVAQLVSESQANDAPRRLSMRRVHWEMTRSPGLSSTF